MTPLETLLQRLEEAGQLITNIDELRGIVGGYERSRNDFEALRVAKQAELDALLADPASAALMTALKAAITGVGL